MRPTPDTMWARLVAHDHGVLSTLHPERGVDAVPVVYALLEDPGDAHGRVLGIPVDLVKPKTSTRLQRVRNLEFDPRATLLVEQWDAQDWSGLWWVRAELRWSSPDGPGEGDGDHDRVRDRLVDALAARYDQYRERPFADVLVFRVVGVTGWAATDAPAD